MFCGNCGAQISDGSKFCPSCGNAIPQNAQPMEPVVVEKKKGMPTILMLLIPVVFVVLLGVVAFNLVRFSGPKGVVRKQMQALKQGNSIKQANLFLPKDVWEEACEEWYDDMDYKDFKQADKKYFDTVWDALKDEGKLKLTYKIKDSESLDKLDELEDEVNDTFYFGEDELDLDAVKEHWDETYGDLGLDTDKIKKAYAVEVDYELEIDGDEAVENSGIFIVYKYKGKWYVMNGIYIGELINGLDKDEYEDVLETHEEAYDEYMETLYGDDY